MDLLLRGDGGAAVKRIVADSPVSPDELRAAAEVHHELGPEYDEAVVESFLQRLGPEIDARVDTRVARELEAAAGQPRAPSMKLAITSMALGIPLTAIVTGEQSVGLVGVLIIWLAIAVINVAYAISSRPAGPRR
jgi:hypothetical protein